MTAPVLAQIDESAASKLMNGLPHALLIHAEAGLDTVRLVEKLATSTPSDLFYLQPEAEKSQISVQQIRDLIYKLRTYANKRRVVIINPAKLMNEEAQNALLKILEEPSSQLHFILATDNKDSLLDTVLSRCQILNLHRTSRLQDSSILEASSLDNQSKQQILFLANGRPALIRQLATDKSLLERYKDMAACAKKIIQADTYESLVSAHKFNSDREEALQLVDILLTMIRFQVKSKGPDIRTKSLTERIEITEKMLKSNSNIKLSLSQLVVQ